MASIHRTVFYSWQSDLPNRTNRGLIQDALEKAARSIRSDDTINVEPVIDRDTTGVPGAPDIGTTIFSKIRRADVFVCDVSIINDGQQFRPTPNPNVLIELGYALEALGWERVILVMNEAFGKPELLPFDLRVKRTVTYRMSDEVLEPAAVRNPLSRTLETMLRDIFTLVETQEAVSIPQPLSLPEQLVEAITERKPNQARLADKYMGWLADELTKLNPDLVNTNTDEEQYERLVAAIEQTTELVRNFGIVAEVISATNALDAARAIFRGFGNILNHYTYPRGYSGYFLPVQFDFYKFMGHELFVTLIAFMFSTEQSQMLAELLHEVMYVENTSGGNAKIRNFGFISEYVGILDGLHFPDKKRTSLHADLLYQRHSDGLLADQVPMRLFVDTDYFLFLRAENEQKTRPSYQPWRAWSSVYMNQIPKFLVEATHIKYAERLAAMLNVGSDINALRNLLITSVPKLKDLWKYTFFTLFEDFDFNTIGR